MLTLAAAAVVVAAVLATSSSSSSEPTPGTAPPSPPGTPSPQPAATTPLGAPPDVPDAGTPAYRHLQDGTDEPVAWDPCRPVTVVVSDRTAPDGAEVLLVDALDEVATATGLVVEVEGPTDEEPSIDREVFQPERYGDRWAPVLVAWTDPAEIPALRGDVDALGGSETARAGDGTEVYVTGTLLLDGPQLAAADEDEVRSALRRELARLVGLAVEDEHDDGPELRAGLARLGGGPCAPDL